MIEKFENISFFESIKKGIQEYGVFLIGVLPKEKPYKDTYVYSIGHKEKNRPDFIVYCDNSNIGSTEELAIKVKAIQSLLNSLVRNWDIKPVEHMQTAQDNLGTIYLIEKVNDKDVKESLMCQASNYYGNYDYEILSLTPF